MSLGQTLPQGCRSADYIQLYSGGKELFIQSLDHIQRFSTQIITAISSSGSDDSNMNSVRSVTLAVA